MEKATDFHRLTQQCILDLIVFERCCAVMLIFLELHPSNEFVTRLKCTQNWLEKLEGNGIFTRGIGIGKWYPGWASVKCDTKMSTEYGFSHTAHRTIFVCLSAEKGKQKTNNN